MYRIAYHLSNRRGSLFIEGVSASVLARRYDTPLYVYSASRLEENFCRLADAFSAHYPKFRAYYSVKANDSVALMTLMRRLGAGADCSSPAEILLAKHAGMKDLIDSSTYYRDDEIVYGAKSGAIVNLDDASKLLLLKRAGYRGVVCFRVNPGLGRGKFPGIITGGKTKFGIVAADLEDAYRKAKTMGFTRFGIHMMAGSDVLDASYFGRATATLLDIAGRIVQRVGIRFDFVNIGGGFGIPYESSERELDIEATARSVVRVLRYKSAKYGLGEPWLFVEPGRYLVGDAGALLTRVTLTKKKPKQYVGVDAGMQTLLRPMLYGAYHRILVANRLDARNSQKVDIVGPICESTDALAENRQMPSVHEGDLLAVLDAGAYCFSMSSTYGGRPRPAEVLVRGRRHALIRKRAPLDDLLRHQRIPRL